MNYQHWQGYNDARYGYGAMLKGFLDHVPNDVTLHEHADVMVNMLQPYQIRGFYAGQHRTCFTMWESTELNPRGALWLNKYDQILVPCDHNVELFLRYHKVVKKVPLGVDHKVWKATPRPDNKRFRFHAGGSQWLRKGLDIVLEAFKRADLDAELHLKPNPEAHGVPPLNLPDNVFMHRHWFTQDETVKFFNDADCYIAATRGEGFGLMPLQAMAMGIPTIINASSGQAEFADLASIVIPHGQSKSIYGGLWDESDPDDLAEAMRHMHANHSAYKLEAITRVAKTKPWSWKNAARKLADALPVGNLLPDPVWEPAFLTMRMRVNRKATGSINGKEFVYLPGQDYVVPENIYQLLLDGGYVLKEPQ
jgi:glycosyltransferase involved in cell wall biosynthesis